VEGSLKRSFARLNAAKISPKKISETLKQAWISPVLTAHPTEVQRKSILDAERAVGDLLAKRHGLEQHEALSENEMRIRARVTQLWQTRLIRFSKLSVDDEIENALSYYQSTFLTEVPKLYERIKRQAKLETLAPIFRMGNWIGGDRDGNPNVTAPTLQRTVARHSETAALLPDPGA
jgi:phosphoenolpyruvate carboxylase